ncbi:membrane dipeptidase-domain-containing protein [Xylaria grammica]|nr:membrane dipeptidase-domain-containing protein [Xylaria grammica]
MESVVTNIIYVGETIGYRYVGIGSDFDGMAAGPTGLEDVSRYPCLFQKLFDHGVSKEDITGVEGMNILRVLESVERVATSMRYVLPLEDVVKPFFGH